MPLAFAPGRSRRLLEGSPLIRAGWVLRGYPGFRTAAGQAVSAPFALPKAVPANRNRLWRRKAGIRGEKPLHPVPRKAGGDRHPGSPPLHIRKGVEHPAPFRASRESCRQLLCALTGWDKSAAASRMTGAGAYDDPEKAGQRAPANRFPA